MGGMPAQDWGLPSPATDAWFSSLHAALGALSRLAPPPDGPAATAAFFNQRPDASTGPNTNSRNPRQEPFAGTFGPYYDPASRKNTWWAFFNQPRK
jgi:hypothetical protein